MLAAENSNCADYHTEKLFHAFMAGVVPVYVGSDTVLDLVPPDSIILASRFKAAEELAAHILHVAGNETLYRSYLEWRDESRSAPPPRLARLIREAERMGTDEWRCSLCTTFHTRNRSATADDLSCSPTPSAW